MVNRSVDRAAVPAPASEGVLGFHRGLDGYRPTPCRDLADLAADLGVARVGLKDESQRLGLPAFKILGASWAVERTLRAYPATTTFVTASSGNHGRAVARAAAMRGRQARIFLPKGSGPTRAELIASEGAQVVRVDGDYDAAVLAAAAAADRPGTALVADTALPGPTAAREADGPPAWVVDGYSTLFGEVDEQVPEGFDVVIVPAGVGSFAAAAARWAAHRTAVPRVVVSEPVTAACVAASLRRGELTTVRTTGTSMSGMDCATPSAVAWPTLHAGLAGAVTVSDTEVHAVMRRLAAAGLVIGDCGASTVAALSALMHDDGCARLRGELGLGPRSRVLCVATEGASDPAAYASVLGARS